MDCPRYVHTLYNGYMLALYIPIAIVIKGVLYVRSRFSTVCRLRLCKVNNITHV